ncbi:TetR/AcrR family transcriptional regulator [Niallia sp. Krafla_26]|uniref:TetR/AcrR family transcriptional regulator n=1 Tax=Niallia sp. Krafla_26 TaxID=3064703 RepID=UPI003D16E7C6
MAKKTDLRVLKTKKLIKDALITLIEEKGFETITIQKIADEAMMNRATFYLHYQDKYDLLQQVTSTYLNELMDAINIPCHLKKGEVDVNRFKITLSKVIEHIDQNRNFYRVMLGPNGIPNFTERVESLLADKFKSSFISIYGELNQLQVPADLILSFIISAYIGVIKWWLSSGSQYSTDFIMEQLANLITQGPMNAMGYKNGFKRGRPIGGRKLKREEPFLIPLQTVQR